LQQLWAELRMPVALPSEMMVLPVGRHQTTGEFARRRLEHGSRLICLVREPVEQHVARRPATVTADEEQKAIGPRWNQGDRELWYGETLCVRYTKAAPHQELILSSFEELDWPRRIDDPLPPGKLANTIADMQKKLRDFDSPLEVGRDGSAKGVWWRVRSGE
jgi:hypothetical protein